MPRQYCYFGWLLIAWGTLSVRFATAQPQPMAGQQLEQDNKQCMEAKTPMQCREALPACQRVAAVLDGQAASHDHDDAQEKALNRMAGCEQKLGQYAEAARHYRQSLHISKRAHGDNHVEVARGLYNLGNSLYYQGKYEEAETLLRQSLGMRQKLLGAEHPDVATSFNTLAVVLNSKGQYEKAEMLHRQALGIRQKLFGAENPEVAASLNNLALVLSEEGKYGEAETMFRKSFGMQQKLLGAEHPNVAAILNNLALVLARQGKYREAERLLRQALEMRQKLLGAEHPDVALSLNYLGNILYREGKYAEAETFNRQALRLQQRLLGAEHPDIAAGLSDLANILDVQGNYREAETLYRQAFGIRQKLFGAESPDVAESLNNLAMVLFNQAKYGEAERFHRQALRMWQKLVGAEHPEVARSLHNLAMLLAKQERYGEAEVLYRQTLAMQQKVLGAEHADLARTLDDLAFVLYQQGKYGEAERLSRRAIGIKQKALGAEYPEVAYSLHNLSSILLARGQTDQALALLRQAARIDEGQLRATVSETRVDALMTSTRDEEDRIYGLLLSSPADPALRQLALSTALLRKGRTAEAGANANRLLHRNLTDPVLRQRFSEWQNVRQQREALLYGGPGDLQPTEYRVRLEDLQIKADSLEAQLSVALPEIKKLQPPDFDAILPAIVKRLPTHSALVEVVWAKPYQAHAIGSQARWGAPHYIALLLFPDQQIRSVDLGEAAGVDSRVRALLAAIRSPQTDPTVAAQALYQQLLVPLLPHLVAVSELFLSLDGMLNLIPFDALHDGKDYLLGRYRFHYLTSGRDLLREPSMQIPAPALVLANPDFGQAGSIPSPTRRSNLYQRLASLARLPGTKLEAELVARLLEVTPLLDSRAREEAVRAAHSPFVLHIATHGLFMNDIELQLPPESTRGLRSFSLTREARTKNVSAPETESLPGDAGAMNRSALVLADVAQGDHANSPAQDGLLTAEEARSLDLDGTQLVVLSACETGQGALSAGQGVYGLRRAFLVAGAETLVTSLWRVHDEATGELMGRYYRKLLDKKTPGDRLGSMQEAMQELRALPGRSHPYYWAPFLVIGQDGPLHPPTVKGP